MFVTGCHRSGTSLLSSLMHGLVTGQDPTKRRGDLERKLENPLGFFESKHLVEINDSLLQVLGCQWDRPPLLPARWDQPPLLEALQPHRSSLEPYALSHAWVDKDPRICITYPAYLHILLRRIPLIVALRDPLAVATSMHARNGFSLNRGLVLWWMYNHHIASQLCSNDLLVPYSTLLIHDDKNIQQFFGPFLEFHKRQRPSNDLTRSLISTLLKPEFNRAEGALNPQNLARTNPLLLSVCKNAYQNIIQAGDQLTTFQECFNSLPRVVLDCSVHDQLLPETDFCSLQNRLRSIEYELRNAGSSLRQRERDCDSLEHQLKYLLNSTSWKITAPLRAVRGFFRASPN